MYVIDFSSSNKIEYFHICNIRQSILIYYFIHICTIQISRTLTRKHLNQFYVSEFTCVDSSWNSCKHPWNMNLLMSILYSLHWSWDNFCLKINILRYCKRIVLICSRWIMHVIFTVSLIVCLLSSCNYINLRSTRICEEL